VTGAADAQFEARHFFSLPNEFDIEVAQGKLVRSLSDEGILRRVPELDDEAVLDLFFQPGDFIQPETTN
jgi:hypothetical protein